MTLQQKTNRKPKRHLKSCKSSAHSDWDFVQRRETFKLENRDLSYNPDFDSVLSLDTSLYFFAMQDKTSRTLRRGGNCLWISRTWQFSGRSKKFIRLQFLFSSSTLCAVIAISPKGESRCATGELQRRRRQQVHLISCLRLAFFLFGIDRRLTLSRRVANVLPPSLVAKIDFICGCWKQVEVRRARNFHFIRRRRRHEREKKSRKIPFIAPMTAQNSRLDFFFFSRLLRFFFAAMECSHW